MDVLATVKTKSGFSLVHECDVTYLTVNIRHGVGRANHIQFYILFETDWETTALGIAKAFESLASEIRNWDNKVENPGAVDESRNAQSGGGDGRTKSGEKTMEYTVIEEQKLERLIENVNLMIINGWKPLGGVDSGVDNEANIAWYCQAMVRGK